MVCWLFRVAGLVAAFVALQTAAPAADTLAAPLHPRYRQVIVAPTKTSIYIGRVSIAMPAFARNGAEYSAEYTTKVFPYFFYNEKGRLWIEFTDEQLLQLERGERVMFHGRARNESGDERRIEGHATPTDIGTGKIKVRVFVTKKIELIFNTTYRFAGE